MKMSSLSSTLYGREQTVLSAVPSNELPFIPPLFWEDLVAGDQQAFSASSTRMSKSDGCETHVMFQERGRSPVSPYIT